RSHMAHGDGIKITLGKIEHVLDRSELRQDAGEGRCETQGNPAVDDGLNPDNLSLKFPDLQSLIIYSSDTASLYIHYNHFQDPK
ncbi:MAG: hypothetical protein KKD92_07750, partial [Proteobacteria bacterium]|nr:hypothetical protein [Pseudomonadota bacterium]